MSTALIAEDEPLLAEHLRSELARLWPELELLGIARDGQQALQAALRQRPDLLFLDIRMPELSGLEVAQALMEDWPEDQALPLLVYVSAYDQYALQAFDQAAADYLVKPLQRERLAQTCARLRERLAQRESPRPDAAMAQLRQLLQAPPQPPLRVLQAQAGNTIRIVPLSDVLYFEAADKYVRVLTRDEEHLVRVPLRELLPQLDPGCFWQVHRSLVVRAEAIACAVRDASGRLQLQLRERPETLNVSRMYAHLFRGM